jgi:hypothetical protein
MTSRHNRHKRTDCRPPAAEERIIRDVYGCAAGRNCAQTTLEQRFFFEKQIAERVAGLPTHKPEGA